MRQLIRAGIAGLGVLALAAHAAGQSNSLFHRQGDALVASQPPPPTRPTVRAPEVILSDVGMPAPTLRRSSDGPPPHNRVLLSASPFAVAAPEPRKIRINDLVTIIIREDKRSTSTAKAESEKSWEVDSVFSRWFRLDKSDRLIPTTFPRGAPGVQFEFESEWTGEGKADRRDSLITRITAKVIDVKPNATLLLEARKTIRNDEDVQIISLTGLCRSEDITAQNTILSTQIADSDITVEHTGAMRDASRRGWLMRLFDFLRPI